MCVIITLSLKIEYSDILGVLKSLVVIEEAKLGLSFFLQKFKVFTL